MNLIVKNNLKKKSVPKNAQHGFVPYSYYELKIFFIFRYVPRIIGTNRKLKYEFSFRTYHLYKVLQYMYIFNLLIV